MKILSQMFPWIRTSPLEIGGNPDPAVDPDTDSLIQTIFSLVDVYGLCLLLLTQVIDVLLQPVILRLYHRQSQR